MEIDRLAEEDELWASLVRGAMLPGFLKKPPPPFEVKTDNGSVTFIDKHGDEVYRYSIE